MANCKKRFVDPILESCPRPTRRGFTLGAIATGFVTVGLDSVNSVFGEEDLKDERTVSPRLFSFIGGASGGWSVLSAEAVIGEALPMVDRVQIVAGDAARGPDSKWLLRGVTSNERYVVREEKDKLLKSQAALGRPEATHAALIPIRKNAKWWALTQDERRTIFEDRSKHTAVGLRYLPAIARRLHHCRDLAESEPFDFLTLFDFTEADIPAFGEMLAIMRASEEWKFVEREVDIRLIRVN